MPASASLFSRPCADHSISWTVGSAQMRRATVLPGSSGADVVKPAPFSSTSVDQPAGALAILASLPPGSLK